jgi:hypothetical protein
MHFIRIETSQVIYVWREDNVFNIECRQEFCELIFEGILLCNNK